MGRRPPWHKGKLIFCDVCGFWYGAYTGKIRKQDNFNKCPDCYDTLTDQQRQDQIRGVIQGRRENTHAF